MNDQAEEVTSEDKVDQVFIGFQEAIDGNKSEDEIKMAMISCGATFKNVTRLYNQYMVDAGLVMSKEDRTEAVQSILDGIDLDTEEAFDAAVEEVENNVTGSTTKSAAAIVRSWAKKNEIEVYKKPTTEGGNRNPFVSNFHEALIENPNMDKEELQSIIDNLEPEHRTNPQRWFNQHNGIRKMANRIAAKYQ